MNKLKKETRNLLKKFVNAVLQKDANKAAEYEADILNYIKVNQVETKVKENFAEVIELIDTMIIDMQGWDLQMTDYDKAFDKGYKDALAKFQRKYLQLIRNKNNRKIYGVI